METTGDKTFFVTTPIYYVNDVPHIGHGYTTVAGDVLTRWHRQRGERVHYLTGTDEHGEKILTASQEHGMTPQEWTDHMVSTAWLPALETIDVANDDRLIEMSWRPPLTNESTSFRALSGSMKSGCSS